MKLSIKKQINENSKLKSEDLICTYKKLKKHYCIAIRSFLLISSILVSPQLLAEEQLVDEVLENCKTASTDQHPILEYQTTLALLRDKKYEEATYCFYRGQLRWRIHLSARPDLNPSGDPTLFGSFNALVGKIVNEWAFSYIPLVVSTMDEVLAWHAANDDELTPKATFSHAHKSQVAGMQRLRDSTVETADDIRKTRTQNGLENR